MMKIFNFQLLLILSCFNAFSQLQFLPYNTGFEGWADFPGTEQIWSGGAENDGGVIIIDNSIVNTGTSSLCLKADIIPGCYDPHENCLNNSTVWATINVDLTNYTSSTFSFFYRIGEDGSKPDESCPDEYCNAHCNEDPIRCGISNENGLYISDDNGESYTKVYGFQTETNLWQSCSINIDELEGLFGLNTQGALIFKFQFIGTTGNDGIISYNYYTHLNIDDVIVTGCAKSWVFSNQSNLNFTPNENGVYVATDFIEASNTTILSNTSVTFNAGNFIKLQKEFKAELNSSFHCFIDGNCVSETKYSLIDAQHPDFNSGSKHLSKKLNCFPNPTTGKFSVSNGSEDAVIGNIKVFNSSGKLIIKQKSNSNSEVIDLSGYPDGIYFLIAESGSQTLTQKIIKE